MTRIAVSPDTFPMASSETLPLRFDTSALLTGAETPSAPTVILTDLKHNISYAAGLVSTPQVSGNYLVQTVAALQAGHRYRLAVTFQAAAGKIWTMELLIPVDF